MSMADPHRGIRCWCVKCDREVFSRDDWRCRCCDPVERINALAESRMISFPFDTLSDYFMRIGEVFAYIHAADIILESLE